jgi:CelD/BcsL family acetyltransferase involved in cellulose biosynthesis
MLKQPTQDLRYVAEGESVSGLNAGWADLRKRSADAAPASGPELVLPFLGKANVASVYAQGQLLLAVPLLKGGLFDQSHHSPITDCGLCHADRLNGPAAVSLLLSKRGKPILLKAIPAQSHLLAMFENAGTHVAVLKTWQRASLSVKGSFEDWLSGNFETKRRKEYKRLRNRLGEQGALKFQSLHPTDDAGTFIEEFLKLETIGWKGSRGTALAKQPATSSATRQALSALHRAGKLRFWSFLLDGQTIASLFAYVDGNKAALGKIAYDEAFGKYSPGVLLILHATEGIFADGTITEVDSSAIPDHPMIDRIWRNRITMADVMVAPASVSPLRFKLIVAAEKMRRTVRAALKFAYHAMKRKSRS